MDPLKDISNLKKNPISSSHKIKQQTSPGGT